MLAHRKKVLSSLFVFLVLMTIHFSVYAEDKTGSIKGKVNYCGEGGYIGMQVFIPGRTFMVLLGRDGNFLFKDVPVGNYDINYVLNGKLVNENKQVEVLPGSTQDLGEIAFCADEKLGSPAPEANKADDPCEANPDDAGCIDADKDGVVASKDCNDNDAAIRPGAIEQCDGVDNNCNGQIDEKSVITILNGTGSCSVGKTSVISCNKGFADCDRDPSNGCETDIYNDRDNCGACGNECSPLESCKLGIC